MQKIIHTKVNRIIVAGLLGIIVSPAIFTLVAHADTEDTSVTYSTMYIPGVTDYNVDGDVTLDVNVAEINALEITLSTSNLAIDLTPKIGIPSFDTDTLDILVGTTNITGYTLTMASSYNGNSTTSLTRTESISSTVPTIDTIGSTVTPTDFASTSDTSSINKWGYLLSATNLDVNKTVYNPVLSSNTVNSSTEAVYNDPTTITFGAKVDSDLPAGNYRATLKFMAVTNPVGNNYNITLNGNGGTIAGNETTTLTGLDTSVVLPTAETTLYRTASTTNTSTRYATLAGWSETPDASTPTYTDALALTEDTNTTLYAVWSFNSGTLQDTSTSCGSNMIDARTGVSYSTYVNGNDCWLSKNLYLAMNDALYPGDSNVFANWTTPTIDLEGTPSSYDIAKIHVGEYDTDTSSGTWFNYCAATAGTICNDTTAQNSSSCDVCPKGWALPSYAQASSLSSSQATTQWNAVAYNVCFDGGTGSAQCYNGQYGLWWTSSIGNHITHRSFLRYNEDTNSFNMMEDGNRGGLDILCVACVRINQPLQRTGNPY